MEELIRTFLEKQPGKIVNLADLEKQIPGYIKYRKFACTVEQLIKEGILIPIGEPGDYSLYNKYRVDKRKLKNVFWEEISKCQLSLHPAIDLGCYFKTSPEIWRQEQKWLERLNQYLNQYGLPEKETSIWERSYEITADEKWISRSGGKGFLKKVGVYDKLKIGEIAEPLMFALNPKKINQQKCYHLIVENKTTFDALMEILPETDLLTLIYGAGKCFLNGIINLEKQLHLSDRQHLLYYFGDLDWEGITIWYLLNKRRPTRLALPFYQALLRKEFAPGKEQQRHDLTAYQFFLSHLPLEEQGLLEKLFQTSCCCPQEALSTEELQQIGRNLAWKDI